MKVEKDMNPIVETMDKALKRLIEIHSHHVIDLNHNQWHMVEVSDLEDLIDEFAQQQKPEGEVKKECIQCDEVKSLTEICFDCIKKIVEENQVTQPQELREAAEKVVESCKYYELEMISLKFSDAIVELQKALNQNK